MPTKRIKSSRHIAVPVDYTELLLTCAAIVADMYIKRVGLQWDVVHSLKPTLGLRKQQSINLMVVPESRFATNRPIFSIPSGLEFGTEG
jgi:hypothetical protein